MLFYSCSRNIIPCIILTVNLLTRRGSVTCFLLKTESFIPVHDSIMMKFDGSYNIVILPDKDQKRILNDA